MVLDCGLFCVTPRAMLTRTLISLSRGFHILLQPSRDHIEVGGHPNCIAIIS